MNPNVIQLRKHPVLDFACQELEAMLREYQDKKPQAGSGEATITWVIGTWEDCARHGEHAFASGSEPGVDDFTIVAKDRYTLLTGVSERATLYAVYQFCKENWNLEWIYPGEGPVRSRNNRPKVGADPIYKPRFQRRGFVYETVYDLEYMKAVVDWLAKNRINELFLTIPLWEYLREELEPEIQKRGLELTLGGHSMKFFLQPSQSPPPTPSPDQNPAQTEGPAFAGRKQVDFADPAWQSAIIDQIVDYCKGVPVLTRLSLWPEDTSVQEDQEQFLTRYIQFSERLRQRLEQTGVPVQVEHIAYNAGLNWNMLELPAGQPSSSAIDTLFAYWGRDYTRGWQEYQRSDEQRALASLKDWLANTRAQGKKLTVFEYYSDHYMLSNLFPSLARRISHDLDDYIGLGAGGIVNLVVPYPVKPVNPPNPSNGEGGGYSWKWAQGFNSYLFARASWGDPLESSLDDYWMYYPDAERESIRKLMERTGCLLAELTYYNIPLFPARAVDTNKIPSHARHSHQDDILAVLEQLELILVDYSRQKDGGSEDREAPYNGYFRHMLQRTQELIQNWRNERRI